MRRNDTADLETDEQFLQRKGWQRSGCRGCWQHNGTGLSWPEAWAVKIQKDRDEAERQAESAELREKEKGEL